MTGLDEIRERMAEHLRAHGLDAAAAYPAAGRKRREGAAAAVSLRGYEGGPAGFQDYLGERFNETTGKWEELYGKKLKLTFGLDLYAPAEGTQALEAAGDALAAALRNGGPAGLKPVELTLGETEWDSASGFLKRPAEAVCEAYLYAVADEGGQFLDFEVRGEKME